MIYQRTSIKEFASSTIKFIFYLLYQACVSIWHQTCEAFKIHQKNLHKRICKFTLIDFSIQRVDLITGKYKTGKYKTCENFILENLIFTKKKKKKKIPREEFSNLIVHPFLLLLIFFTIVKSNTEWWVNCRKSLKKPRDRSFRPLFFLMSNTTNNNSGRSCFFRNCAHVRGGAGVSAEYTRIYTGSFRFVTQPNFPCTSRHYRMAGGSGGWEVCALQLICVAESVLYGRIRPWSTEYCSIQTTHESRGFEWGHGSRGFRQASRYHSIINLVTRLSLADFKIAAALYVPLMYIRWSTTVWSTRLGVMAERATDADFVS